MENKARQHTVVQINEALKKYVDVTKMVLTYAGDFHKKD